MRGTSWNFHGSADGGQIDLSAAMVAGSTVIALEIGLLATTGSAVRPAADRPTPSTPDNGQGWAAPVIGTIPSTCQAPNPPGDLRTDISLRMTPRSGHETGDRY